MQHLKLEEENLRLKQEKFDRECLQDRLPRFPSPELNSTIVSHASLSCPCCPCIRKLMNQRHGLHMCNHPGHWIARPGHSIRFLVAPFNSPLNAPSTLQPMVAAYGLCVSCPFPCPKCFTCWVVPVLNAPLPPTPTASWNPAAAAPILCLPATCCTWWSLWPGRRTVAPFMWPMGAVAAVKQV